MPFVNSGIKKLHDLVGLQIKSLNLVGLSSITCEATKSQVLEAIISAQRDGNNMLDRECNVLPFFRGMAIFTQKISSLSNCFLKG